MLPSNVAAPGADASRSFRTAEYVLIALPNVTRATAWRHVAAESGREVVVVRDGEEARQQIARRGVPALLISALSLPKIDGFALLRYLRSQSSGDRSGVVVVSAHQPLRDVARELSDSMKIAKVLPLDADEPTLREAIDSALRAHPRHSVAVVQPATVKPALTETIGPAKTLAEVVGRAVVDAALRFGTSASSVYIRDQRGERLTVFSSTEDPTAGNVQPDDWVFVREVATSGEPMVIPNLADHPLFAQRAPGSTQPILGLVGVPIFPTSQRITGALCLVNRPSLTLDASEIDEVSEYAVALGNEIEAVLALPSTVEEAAHDIAALEQLAMTDSLTGLFNRRGAEKTIATEVSRARRLGTSVSCLMIDIDQFKRINDTLGHLVGDDVLRHISRVLKKTVRAYDTVSRWGGEEFLLLLPGVELEQAQRLAERVRVNVHGLKLETAGTVTVSIGVATLGSDYNFETTLRAADQQLYRAKQSGRNCVF